MRGAKRDIATTKLARPGRAAKSAAGKSKPLLRGWFIFTRDASYFCRDRGVPPPQLDGEVRRIEWAGRKYPKPMGDSLWR